MMGIRFGPPRRPPAPQGGSDVSRSLGLAGRVAAAATVSPLTPLVIIMAVLAGVFAIAALPREEEPQIVVPMIDIFVEMPGASPAEVEQRLTRPVEKLIWEIPGVEYLYSTSSAGRMMIIARFLVGQDEEAALARLNQKLAATMDRLPAGASAPMVIARSIDDVPVMAVTLWAPGWDDFRLRQLAAQLHDSIKEVRDVSEVTIIGGRTRQLSVVLDPARMASHSVDPLTVRDAIASTNVKRRVGELVQRQSTSIVEVGDWTMDASDVANTVIGSAHSRLLVRDVATIADGPADPTSYVTHYPGDGRAFPAVTLSIAKRKGTNAIDLTRRIEQKLESVHGVLVPTDVQVSITRNYGETAAEKSDELLWHMFLAVISVAALIWFALGRREALVVLVAIPVTLALTLFVFYLYGYTLNRITLFALIFSIGILVDDAIVVVENVVRHARLAGAKVGSFATMVVAAVDEVGNPTILATLTVVAAILPMAFVGGLMGPYMRPIPVGASAAMVFSLVVAFAVTPWAAVRLLKSEPVGAHGTEDRLTVIYRRVMGRLLQTTRSRVGFLAIVALLLALSVALLPAGLVTVKMLPFDNKSEFDVLVNMPDGTPLEETARVVGRLADRVLQDEDVVHVQTYVGTSAPYNFNGLVRHYFLRRGSHQAELQVNLAHKSERPAQSHEIAGRTRVALASLADELGARIQVTEVPPGPPVLQTLVAEVYGPELDRRIELAEDVREVFRETPGVVDIDWYVESPRAALAFEVDVERAAAAGVAPSRVAAVTRAALSGEAAGLVHDPSAREAVPVVLQLPRRDRSSRETLLSLQLAGGPAIGDLVRVQEELESPSLHHKNLMPVTYVTADLAGSAESPVYAILQMNRTLAGMDLPEGYAFEVFSASHPTDTTRYAMKWDGEWHITYEVFRDLGIAFAAVLVLIYVLVVGWFRSFVTPLVIMAAIPFSLVGILPAHAAMGAYFTATSMIGFIAGAGIVVRNSIILVDFIELRLRDGMSFDQAVIDAGAIRFRPMALTAAAVVVGAAVILFDPIFQGLAISLMAGEVASLLLSRMAVPVMYHLVRPRQSRQGEYA